MWAHTATPTVRLLGVAPLINAQGHITTLGGSRMPEPVVEAMVRASKSFVQLNELHQKAGAHIAKLVGAPAAFVSDGAASGMFLCGCAVLAGADSAKIKALPTVASGKNEFIISQVEGWSVHLSLDPLLRRESHDEAAAQARDDRSGLRAGWRQAREDRHEGREPHGRGVC